MNKQNKILLFVGILLFLYGFLCRVANLNFFWEAKSIGLTLILISVVLLLRSRIKARKMVNKKSVFEKISIALISLFLLGQIVLLIAYPMSDAYSVAKRYLVKDVRFIKEVGLVRGFSFSPTGTIKKSVNSEGVSGSAILNLTVKGELKYKDIVVYVSKYPDKSDWEVEEVDYN